MAAKKLGKINECANCAVLLPEDDIILCNICESTSYCSNPCKDAHWNDCHKNMCKKKDRYHLQKQFTIFTNKVNFYCGICCSNCLPDHNIKYHQKTTQTCGICLEKIDNQEEIYTTECYHTFHQICIETLVDKTKASILPTCPICRTRLSLDVNQIIQELYKLNKEPNKDIISKLIQSLVELADRNNFAAQYWLGFIYRSGFCVEKDYKKSFKYFKCAAEHDTIHNMDALYNVGLSFHHGFGVDQDYSMASDYYTKAIEKNHPYAILDLGVIYYFGLGVEKDCKKGFECFTKSAQDYKRTQYYMGDAYESGDGVKQNNYLAYKYYNLAANNGHKIAQYRLGNLYFYGRGVKHNNKLALKYYTLSAKQNDREALFMLGYLHEKGLCGVKQHYKMASLYYTKAAEQGHSTAQLNLAILYHNGFGVDQDLDLAVKYYILAAKDNHSEAQSNLGVMYQNGQGLEQDYAKAFYYYSLAANQDNPLAESNLGYLYYYGYGVEQNHAKALEYYTRAANKKNAGALYMIGVIYENGNGVEKNLKIASKYYSLAHKLR
jgi:TPR repeat protein